MANGHLNQCVGRVQPFIEVMPKPVIAQAAPSSSNKDFPKGQEWLDESVSPAVFYIHKGNGVWTANNLVLSTDGTFAAALDTTASSSLAIKTYVDATAIAGAPVATESTAGIGELATDIEARDGTASTGALALLVTPSNLSFVFAAPPAIGGTTPAAATFTDLTTSGTVNIIGDAAMLIDVAGAGIDLTLSSDAGRVIVNGEEAAANAITLLSAAGGIDADAALQINVATSQNAADAIVLNASAGGIDITAAGAAAEDLDLVCTAGSVNITAGESAADSIVITSSIGGIDILAAGAAAGEDIDIVATGSSVNITSTENVANAIVLNASAGGIDITNTGTAGEDIDIASSGASVNVSSTENAALAVYLNANGGTAETIRLRSFQGTGAGAIDLLASAGGVTITGALASADAINLNASNAGGGIDIDSGTAGTILDSTGAISLDAAAASNFTVTGAGIDLTLDSAAGRVVVNGEEAAVSAVELVSAAGGISASSALQLSLISSEAAVADSVRIQASAADGGIDCDAGTGGIAIDTTGALSLQAAAASDYSVSGAGIDLTLASAAGRVIVNGEEAASNAITLLSAAGGIDVDAALDIVLTSTENAADSIYLRANGGTSETVRIHSDQGTGAASVHLESDVGGVTLTSGLASADAINLVATNGGIDCDAALQVNVASSQAATGALTLAVSNAAANITHTGACAYTPDSITSDNAGVAASINTVTTLITTDGDSNEDNVTLADGLLAGQIKHFVVIAAGNAADSIKITPANMAGGTKITFAADPTGLGCSMVFDGTNWAVFGNNAGTIA